MKKSIILTVCLFHVIQAETPQYFDYAASWVVNETALNEFDEVSRMNGNSSGINSHAKHLKKLEEQSVQVIANKIGAQNPQQIHFTSGATVANNIAIFGVAYKNPKCHLITSKIEHKSVLNVFKHLERNGWRVTYLDVDRYGHIDLKQLKDSVRPDTKLISIQTFNSEIGTLQNISEIGKIAHKHGILFHSDASQSFCKYDINVDKLYIDLLTVSGYKIGSPKGIGALYVKDIEQLQPIMFGSGDILFPGTKPTALICAFAKAVETFKIDKTQITRNFEVLTSELRKIDNVYINSVTPSHVVSVSIDKVLLKDVLEAMEDFSFAAGCSCLGQDKSNVMTAIDPQDKLPSCTLRISFTDKTSEQQLINFAQKLKSEVERLRKEKSVGKGCESNVNTSGVNLNDSLDKITELIKMGVNK